MDDLDAMRATIVAAFPELASSRFTPLTAGWDCTAIDADDRLIFKFPRNSEAETALVYETGILALIRPRVSMPVPDIALHPGLPPFSRHAKLRGEHLVTAQYDALPEAARQALGEAMALFYAELHALPVDTMTAAGAGAIKPWLEPDDILRLGLPVMPEELRNLARRTIADWQELPPDPFGITYGFFDGHGWNMAFDHAAQKLNGVYDFGDSGLGPLHQEFIYSNWISRDLTARIIARYEAITGRRIDRRRVEILSAVLRLSELALFSAQPAHLPRGIAVWAEWVGGGP